MNTDRITPQEAAILFFLFNTAPGEWGVLPNQMDSRLLQPMSRAGLVETNPLGRKTRATRRHARLTESGREIAGRWVDAINLIVAPSTTYYLPAEQLFAPVAYVPHKLKLGGHYDLT